MKLDILRKIIREEVKGAIQEELKDLLLEAIRTPKQPIGIGHLWNALPIGFEI